MNAALQKLSGLLGYTFRNPELLVRAVTHPSYLQDHPEVPDSNQRLEFLGDAVLQLVLSDELFQRYPDDREGTLSQNRAALSKGSFLTALALELHLDDCLLISKSEEDGGGRTRASALEDALEALLAAIYLDGGFAEVSEVLLRIYGPLSDRLASVGHVENPKGRLQELVQPEHGNHAIRYEVTTISGEAHAREFEVAVYFNDQPLATGRGSSKKQAEESAARSALAVWPETPHT